MFIVSRRHSKAFSKLHLLGFRASVASCLASVFGKVDAILHSYLLIEVLRSIISFYMWTTLFERETMLLCFVSLSLVLRASAKFALKDTGVLTYFLGLEITSRPTGLFISQAKYSQDILTCAQLLNSKPIATPLVGVSPCIRMELHSVILFVSFIGRCSIISYHHSA